LGVGAALQFGQSFGGGARFLVGAVAGDGVVGVGHGDDSRAKRNFFAGQRMRIT